MFIESLFSNTHHFVFVVVTVVFSISLHELAHGWVATWQGDPTPRDSGHLTINPAVHMGPISIFMLLFMGMAYGLMPVDPTRFRSKYGDAMVSAAGPLMNLLLAVIGLTIFGIWVTVSGGRARPEWDVIPANSQQFLLYFGTINIALAILNTIPIPPLDGSTILANFAPGYARWIKSIQNPAIFMYGLFMILILMSSSSFGFLSMGNDLSVAFLKTLFGEDILRYG